MNQCKIKMDYQIINSEKIELSNNYFNLNNSMFFFIIVKLFNLTFYYKNNYWIELIQYFSKMIVMYSMLMLHQVYVK